MIVLFLSIQVLINICTELTRFLLQYQDATAEEEGDFEDEEVEEED